MALNDKLRFRHGMRVHPNDVISIAQYPVAMAVLIDSGFMTDWPHEWTRDGRRSVRRHRVDDGRHRGWNCIGVLSEAGWHAYAVRERVVNKPNNREAESLMRAKLGLLRGQVTEEEAIDAAD